MTEDPAEALIAEHIRRLMEVMGLQHIRLECEFSGEETLRISMVVGDEGSMLIGTQGATLNALQHIIRCVLRKQLHEHVRVIVDVNGYRLRRERSLLGFAEETARRAQKTGRPVALSPMSATDRRTIHAALAGRKEVVTESTGDGDKRRVVIRPVFL